ncbi:MAG: sigma-70 family RNA polymerase sigma factor [Fibrobacter sp.]|mgnify:CR=1 FL=1|nr:sigma-70 family RNA polymerase sigma factor [Fibrobacter sp.]
MDEQIILQRLKEGSREALSLLWKMHSSSVLNLANRMMKNRDVAEDILMDLFVHVPKAIKGFRGESSLRTWLYRLTVNMCLMKLRSSRRHNELEEENLDLIVEQALGKSEGPLIPLFGSSATVKLLEKGIDALPAQTRSMLWLKDAENLDIKALAEIYRMPEGTIKARLSRARQQVRVFINESLSKIGQDHETKEPRYA